MAGTSRKTIEDTIDSRIAALENQKATHLAAVDDINAKLGMARLIRDDLAPEDGENGGEL